MPGAARADADRSFRVHDAVPRDARPLRQRVERVADEARVVGQSRETRDLPVRGDAAARDPRDGGVDERVRAQGSS